LPIPDFASLAAGMRALTTLGYDSLLTQLTEKKANRLNNHSSSRHLRELLNFLLTTEPLLSYLRRYG